MKPLFSLFAFILFASCLCSCKGSGTTADSKKDKTDACSLITAEEFNNLQGEPLKDAKAANATDGDLDVSQCFYAAQTTFSRSVSVVVTQNTRAKDPSEAMKELWESRFAAHDDDKDDDADKERKPASAKREEDEEGSAAIKVNDLGDEAFWMGDARSGILYVLHNNYYLRISLGGADDQDTRLRKATQIAKTAFDRIK